MRIKSTSFVSPPLPFSATRALRLFRRAVLCCRWRMFLLVGRCFLSFLPWPILRPMAQSIHRRSEWTTGRSSERMDKLKEGLWICFLDSSWSSIAELYEGWSDARSEGCHSYKGLSGYFSRYRGRRFKLSIFILTSLIFFLKMNFSRLTTRKMVVNDSNERAMCVVGCMICPQSGYCGI